MKVKIKKLNEKAEIPFKTYKDDFCYDVVATSCEEIARNTYRYGVGLAFEIDRENPCCYMSRHTINSHMPLHLSIDLRPRSSIYKTGMVFSCSTGTIDEQYRGEMSMIFYHLFPDRLKYEVGDKIGQIKLGFTIPMEFDEVRELSKTLRGDGGYGSTGR